MSIKSDRWIRRMALQHSMIEPFAPLQVRVADGHKIVSYGTSSYGYDVRCADEFKIFTNINSTIVDPKNFDEKSFVDFKGPVCIIPPNSFALASTVEFFRIPRSVLTVCLGKCVTGDTRVVDAQSGAYVPITEMQWGKSTLALDSGKLKPAKVSAFLPQGRKEVFELRTRAGLRIRATASHPFRQMDGWTALGDLRPGDRIAAARDIPIFGRTPIPDWEASLLGLTLSQGQCDADGHGPAYATADSALVSLLNACAVESGMGGLGHEGRHRYRLVEGPGRGAVPGQGRVRRWLRGCGLDVEAGERHVPQSVFTAPERSVRLFLQALLSGDAGISRSTAGVSVEFSARSRRLIEDIHHLLLRFGVFALIREKTSPMGARACTIRVADEEQLRRFAQRIGFTPGSMNQQQLELEVLPSVRAQARPTMGAAVRVARTTGDRFAASVIDGPLWDVVEHIEPAGVDEVFDISVPALHNFVANGLIVHNSTYARCGIIVNVTPLEPEWEGHVTLEFSNTTPLPAKIYANEGVAQMLFFESDEVCETSYRDRGGKYQGQRGVTLPKT